jgi:hypothetical protein
MGGSPVEFHDHDGIAEDMGEVSEESLKRRLVQVGVGLAPVPSAHRVNHPLGTAGFQRLIVAGLWPNRSPISCR